MWPLTDVSSLEVIIELVDVQVERIHEVHFVPRVVPCHSVAQSNVVLQHHKSVSHREAVQASHALLKVHEVALFFAHHRCEVQAAHLVDLALIHSHTVDRNFAQDLGDLSHDGHAVPSDQKQALASSNDVLVLLSVDGDAEADGVLTHESEHVHLVVVVEVHLEDLPAENVAPEH